MANRIGWAGDKEKGKEEKNACPQSCLYTLQDNLLWFKDTIFNLSPSLPSQILLPPEFQDTASPIECPVIIVSVFLGNLEEAYFRVSYYHL